MNNGCTCSTDSKWPLSFLATRRQARLLYVTCVLTSFVTMFLLYNSSYRTTGGSKIQSSKSGAGQERSLGNILEEKRTNHPVQNVNINHVNKNVLSSSDSWSFKAPIFYDCKKMDTTSELLSMPPPRYNRKFKNPCWYEDLNEADVYSKNKFADYYKNAKLVFEDLTEIWKQKLSEESEPKRLRCLPYFFIAGQPKCGSTDLYQKIASHPDVVAPPVKESHWWGKNRFGWRSNYSTTLPFSDYIDLYDKVAINIDHVHDPSRGDEGEEYHQLITGDASVSTLWDHDEWWRLKENCGETEPKYTNADYVHHFLPHAKIIVILRDPVDRLWSDYLYFQKSSKSLENFHKNVVTSINIHNNCTAKYTLQSCIYNRTLANLARVRLRIGIYYAYIETWLNIYPRDQIYILRLEDYATNNRNVMKNIYKFLGLRELTRSEADYILGQPVANARRKGDRKIGKMREETRKLIEEFYEPYNKRLSLLLNDNKFMWKDNRRGTTPVSVVDSTEKREKRSGRRFKTHEKLLKTLKQRIKDCESRNL